MSTNRQAFLVMVLLGAMALPGALAQDPTFAVRRSENWSDRRLDGECIIRVVIDNHAEVELRWDKVLIRTLAGQPGRDNGSECNAPLPQGPVSNFQFQRLEGAGDFELMQQPSAENGWAAVVRLRDRESGYHRYSYRMTWSSAGASTDRNQTFQRDRFPRDQYEGRAARGRYNPERVCRDAVAARVLEDWGARVVRYGRRADSRAQNEGIWSYGGEANVEGRAQVSTGVEQRQIAFTCVVDENTNTVQQVDYNFANNRPFSWTPNRGSADRVANPNVISDCQNEVRERVETRHGMADIDFRDISRKWWEGNTQRVNGRAKVNFRGYQSTIEYNCTAKGAGIDWADFKVLTGTLPRANQ